MKLRALLLAAALVAPVAGAADKGHWGYAGQAGPAHWGEISADYHACAEGREQSPVDLRGPVPAMVEDLSVEWGATPLELVNNGRTIQANVAEGSRAVAGGVSYRLAQFHFHHPSEHTVTGERRALEIHFVHKSAEGRLLVLGVFVTPGAANPTLEAIWDAMPENAGGWARERTLIQPRSLLPADATSYRYAGSLTTPPCSEVVDWVVYRAPISASPAQIERFAKLFPMNARPVQPMHRRVLLLDFF